MINRLLLRKNINLCAILLYFLLFAIIIYIEPHFLYEKDGSLRDFGIGRKKKTIFPVWLLSIMIAIFSYFSILYILNSHKF